MQSLVIIEAQGKVRTWQKVLEDIGIRAAVLATHGHVFRFPDRLDPLGISIDANSPCDPGRTADPQRLGKLHQAIDALDPGARVFIASDDDPEGDVIALDVIESILRHNSALIDRIYRVRPGALTRDGITAALAAAEPLRETGARLIAAALPGRARAISDRWIGATFSRMAGHPVGRVRSALLGAFFLLERAPAMLRDTPELGEITFRCRSASGGQPFVARVALDGRNDRDLTVRQAAMAARHVGGMVPGVVRPRESLSAAVAPRIGNVRPFNTGDALAHASRHFSLGAVQAMRGLQDGYMSGFLSYPRTDSHEISRESAVRVARLADACRISGVEVVTLSDRPSLIGGDEDAAPIRTAHEALHPVCDLEPSRVAELERLTRSPLRFNDHSGDGPELIRDIMITIVARRAFEAGRRIEMEVGDWRPDNVAAIPQEEAELLEDLDWQREAGPALPWSKDLMTGTRIWPLRAVVIDMMMIEGLGRASTLAYHADTAERSGEIDPGSLLQPPRPTPMGVSVLRKIPKGLWNPATCRMIEAANANTGGLIPEEPSDTLQTRVRKRVTFWLGHLSEEMRDALLESFDKTGDGRAANAQGPAKAMEMAEAEDSSFDVPTGLGSPSPFVS